MVTTLTVNEKVKNIVIPDVDQRMGWGGQECVANSVGVARSVEVATSVGWPGVLRW